jgi:hypothetical protein
VKFFEVANVPERIDFFKLKYRFLDSSSIPLAECVQIVHKTFSEVNRHPVRRKAANTSSRVAGPDFNPSSIARIIPMSSSA